MKRYQHTYGGIATEVGTFSAKEIIQFFELGWNERNHLIEQSLATPAKLLDFIGEDREVLIYGTGKRDKYRVVCINRETTEQAQVKWDQFYAKRDWLKLNPIPGRK
jgi:hypothetical protein